MGDIKVVAHPSELFWINQEPRLFVFSSIADRLHVIDLSKRQVIATWAVTSEQPGDAAFDECNIAVVYWNPQRLPK